MAKQARCRDCNGSGQWNVYEDCGSCKGRGWIEVDADVCSDCAGYGTIPMWKNDSNPVTCAKCKGTGRSVD